MKKYILLFLLILPMALFAQDGDSTGLSDGTAENVSTGITILLAALGIFGGGAAVIAWVRGRFARLHAFIQTVVGLMDGLHNTFQDGKATGEELQTNYAQWQEVKAKFADLIK